EAVQIFNDHSPALEKNLGVVTGDGQVVHGQIIVRRAPDSHRAASHRHFSYEFAVKHEAEFRHLYFPPALPLLPRFLSALRRNHENHPLESLSIRAMTTVMLSGPPRSLAMPTSSSAPRTDRKSTRLNSSHVSISYAVFCLKKKSRWLDAAQCDRTASEPVSRRRRR